MQTQVERVVTKFWQVLKMSRDSTDEPTRA